METQTRTEAVRRGLYKYFTGVPCKNGHLTLRYTNTSVCIACHAAYQKAYKAGYKSKKSLAIRSQFEVFHVDDLKRVQDFVTAVNFERELLNHSC